MGCCCPEYGGVEDTAGMQVFDSFGPGSRRRSGKMDCQECNIRSCWTWSQRLKKYRKSPTHTTFGHWPCHEQDHSPAAIVRDVLPARLEDQLCGARIVASQSREQPKDCLEKITFLRG